MILQCFDAAGRVTGRASGLESSSAVSNNSQEFTVRDRPNLELPGTLENGPVKPKLSLSDIF